MAYDQVDYQRLPAIRQAVSGSLTAADEALMRKRRVSVLRPLSAEGQLNMEVTVVQNCRANPTWTIARAAAETIDGIYQLQRQMGLFR